MLPKDFITNFLDEIILIYEKIPWRDIDKLMISSQKKFILEDGCRVDKKYKAKHNPFMKQYYFSFSWKCTIFSDSVLSQTSLLSSPALSIILLPIS